MKICLLYGENNFWSGNRMTVVVAIGDENVPPKGTKDPEILRWIEDNGFILVTNNRSSMPVHLVEILAEGRHVPGILVLRPSANIGRVIEV